jgi:hypothetical protein
MVFYGIELKVARTLAAEGGTSRLAVGDGHLSRNLNVLGQTGRRNVKATRLRQNQLSYDFCIRANNIRQYMSYEIAWC